MKSRVWDPTTTKTIDDNDIELLDQLTGDMLSANKVTNDVEQYVDEEFIGCAQNFSIPYTKVIWGFMIS